MRVIEPESKTQQPAGVVLVILLIAFGLGLLFNAESLHAAASRQPFGWRRTLALDVMGPVRSAARTARLDRPRVMFDEALGHDESGGRKVASAPKGGVTAVSAPTTTTVPVPRVRQPTAAKPLSLWVGGDSMAQVFGQSLQRMAVDRGDIDATLDYRISTGLTRPDFFDWPAHFADDVLPAKPEVLVVIFGANDSQPMVVDGKPQGSDSPEWQAEYRRRTAAAMDELAGQGRLVIWVGEPVMRDDRFSQRMARLDVIYQEEAAKRPWIRYLDTRAMFANSGGHYSAYLPGADGRPVLMRQGDGIHLSRAGGDRLAAAVLAVLDDEIPAAS